MTQSVDHAMSGYVAKLERRRILSPDVRDAIFALPATIRHVEERTSVMDEDAPAEHSVFLLDGLLSRQKRLDGRGQIVSISFPGDAVDLQTLFFERVDHALVAHLPSRVAYVPHGALIDLCDRHPLAARMLWHDTLVDSAIFREWAMNIGHRRAANRIGFLLLEYEARMSAIGEIRDGAFTVALTQQELASALGLSLVHMNKSLKRLRDDKLVETHGRAFRILDRDRLTRLVEFDSAYLHLSTSPILDKATGFTCAVSPA